jgi:DNA phosphorothioation-dependent restriction protein DptG
MICVSGIAVVSGGVNVLFKSDTEFLPVYPMYSVGGLNILFTKYHFSYVSLFV